MKTVALAIAAVSLQLGCGLPPQDAPGADELGSTESALAAFTGWTAPVDLGIDVNSTVNDIGVFVSQDELQLFFVSNRPGGMGGQDVYVARRASKDVAFADPVAVPVLNSSADELCPMLTPDMLTMIYSSARPGGCGNVDMYITHRADANDDQGWSAPVNIGCGVNGAAVDSSPTLLPDESGSGGLVYFFSTRAGGAGNADIYSTQWDGADGFTAPTLVTELDTAQNDMRPDIRHDGKEIFFQSNRPGSSGDDLWVSTRVNGAWTTPTNVSSANSSANDGSPSISWDGQSLYFYSNRPGGVGLNDIYVATRSKLHGNTP